jgi:hypothetical protein
MGLEHVADVADLGRRHMAEKLSVGNFRSRDFSIPDRDQSN